MCAKSLQSCLTVCDPMDYSLPGSSIHGIFQARILEWVAISFSFPTQGSNLRLQLPDSWMATSRNLLGEGNGTPLQYSCLENPMDRGAWWAAVHGAAKSQTRLSDFPFSSHFPALEKEMAAHARVLAWRIPGTGEPGGLPSMGSHRVGLD